MPPRSTDKVAVWSKLESVDDDRHHFLSGGINSDVCAQRKVGYGFRLGRREQSLADDTVGICQRKEALTFV